MGAVTAEKWQGVRRVSGRYFTNNCAGAFSQHVHVCTIAISAGSIGSHSYP